MYLNVASTRPLELVPRRPPALKEDNFCSFAHQGRHQQFFLDIVLNNGGVRSPKLLKLFETLPESKTMLLIGFHKRCLPVSNIHGNYGDAKVARKNNGGRNK